MSDIFREVDEAMQKEKAAKLWKEYGPTLMLAAIVLVVSTGIGTAYRSWTSHENVKATTKLVMAAEEKDIAAAMEKAAQGTDDGHKIVALMNAAAKYASDQKFDKAADLYDSAAKDASAPSDLRDLSTILYVRAAQIAAPATDETGYKALADRLSPIAANEKSAFRLQAKLDAALLYGDGLKDYTKALDLLKGFDGESIADSLKEKATALKHVYEYESSQTPSPAPSQQP